MGRYCKYHYELYSVDILSCTTFLCYVWNCLPCIWCIWCLSKIPAPNDIKKKKLVLATFAKSLTKIMKYLNNFSERHIPWQITKYNFVILYCLRMDMSLIKTVNFYFSTSILPFYSDSLFYFILIFYFILFIFYFIYQICTPFISLSKWFWVVYRLVTIESY